jgi:hypothetical protein
MAIKLIANIEHHEGAGYVAWIDNIKGMVVQASTIEDVCKELFISLKVKLAYNLGISASEIKEIDENEAKLIERQISFQKEGNKAICKKEINLTLS